MTLSKMLTFLIRKFGGQKTVGQCVQRAKRKNCRSRILYPVKLFFKSEGVIKTFLAKKKKKPGSSFTLDLVWKKCSRVSLQGKMKEEIDSKSKPYGEVKISVKIRINRQL